MALSDDKLWDLWNAQGTDDMSRVEAFTFARAIESEVRKQDTELIRQLVEALEDFDDAGPIGEGWKSAQLLSLLASARAWLEVKP